MDRDRYFANDASGDGDAATDIAILKVEGNNLDALLLAASSAVKTGDKICTIGYPNIQMQGQEAKLPRG